MIVGRLSRVRHFFVKATALAWDGALASGLLDTDADDRLPDPEIIRVSASQISNLLRLQRRGKVAIP